MEANASGYGYGDASGYGDGYGYGDGSGYGDGEKQYYAALLRSACGERFKEFDGLGASLCFWRSGKDGEPVNGGSKTRAKVGLVEEIAGPLQICSKGALHGTLKPWNYKGERLWIVALYPPIQESDDKIGSLKREFLAEIPNLFEKKS